MKQTNIKIKLTDSEKQKLKANKLKTADVINLAIDELEVMLNVSFERAREIYALAKFQTIPSIGVKFAEDLILLGYYTIEALRGKDGAKLTEEFEQLKGYWIDPCVEDQFRLAIYYANTGDCTKKWWDFTAERKKYRLENASTINRPQLAWHETLEYSHLNGKISQ